MGHGLSSSLDRIAPSRRPLGPEIGYQSWRDLLFLHWPVPVERLRPLVPPVLQLDQYEGVSYVGLVPFAMHDVRWRRWPKWSAFHFLETNVRTYVHDGRRPGVYFFSLDASSWLAVQAARCWWGLPYHFSQMQLQRQGDETLYTVQRRGGGETLRVRYRQGEHLGASQPGTLEHFLLERYLMFVSRGQRMYVGQVHHAPYPAQLAHVESFEDQLVASSGLPPVAHPPALAHFAAGVDVDIYPLRRLDVAS